MGMVTLHVYYIRIYQLRRQLLITKKQFGGFAVQMQIIVVHQPQIHRETF